jgi:hypothetical protein
MDSEDTKFVTRFNSAGICPEALAYRDFELTLDRLEKDSHHALASCRHVVVSEPEPAAPIPAHVESTSVAGAAETSCSPGGDHPGGVFKAPRLRLVPSDAAAPTAAPPRIEGFELDVTSEADLRETVSVPLIAARLGLHEMVRSHRN